MNVSDYIRFEATIEPLTWGKNTYTILRIPEDAARALLAQGAKRVEGEINDHPVNFGLSTSPEVDGLFLWTGKTTMTAIGVAPFDPLEVRLRKADPDEVETPTDVMNALHDVGKTAAWEALTAGKRRGMLYQINTAKRAETRARRIAKLTDEL